MAVLDLYGIRFQRRQTAGVRRPIDLEDHFPGWRKASSHGRFVAYRGIYGADAGGARQSRACLAHGRDRGAGGVGGGVFKVARIVGAPGIDPRIGRGELPRGVFAFAVYRDRSRGRGQGRPGTGGVVGAEDFKGDFSRRVRAFGELRRCMNRLADDRIGGRDGQARRGGRGGDSEQQAEAHHNAGAGQCSKRGPMRHPHLHPSPQVKARPRSRLHKSKLFSLSASFSPRALTTI